ncbi:PD-(D/E)XK nuclease-like domain-containing protein [Hymenobacter sp. H14-R3]|uniref:PD-(D/E)XK nuclease-like domain-containing protein n=1 Tax=Hymenobacter sp. H14-R3 TaxID=3046308 RepID=UPI0024BAAD18|nr:PD-(D/E)XK nuclease-like domain-containing protein [Hymenobacter sp. H14-R3]MDJ0364864.1 PD-(D/E)XK nuclease-like domain-containing protein [Hymenobacter sp. H14-R3]
MFYALTHHPGLTQAQHRALPHVSNTDLSNLKASILGQLRRPNPVALAFGSHFHTAVLEPGQYQRTDERGIKWPDLEALARQLRRQRYCRDLLYRGQAEQSYTAMHTATGVGVKLRPDLLVRSRAGRQLTLIDFKTSSAPDLAHFLATIEKYDYDRQAALYLDVLGATRFLIIGVQKKAPYQVWRVELTAMPGLIEQGRKKYTALLRHHARQLLPASAQDLAAPAMMLAA